MTANTEKVETVQLKIIRSCTINRKRYKYGEYARCSKAESNMLIIKGYVSTVKETDKKRKYRG